MPMTTWADGLVRDVRMGIRMLGKNPAATGAAFVSLSLAVGACVAAFSLVDALILRALPVRDPARLVYLAFPTYTAERPESETFNDPVFLRMRDAARGHADLVAMSTHVMRRVVFGGGDKEPVRTQFVSGDAFGILGILPAAGRLLAPGDDEPGGGRLVAVVSHAFWRRRFGGDPAAVGRWFALDDRQFQIVGIAEPRFPGIEPGRPTDVWLPYHTYDPHAFGNASYGWFRVLGRIRDGVSVSEVQSRLQAAFTTFRLERAPTRLAPGQTPESVARVLRAPLFVRSAANGPSPLRRQFERSLWILGSIALLVLLVAGSNVANLFLARTAAREREMSLRLSIGASRARLIQQLLIESGLLATAACASGLLIARAAAPAVVGMFASADDPVHLDLRVDWRLVAVVTGFALLTSALAGLAPALRASHVAPIAALKAGEGRTSFRAGMMRPFVAIQVAFSLVVVFVGGLLVMSFARLSSVNPGFASADLLLVNVEAAAGVEAAERRRATLDVLDRLSAVPGVRAVSAAEFNVLGRAWTHYVRVPGTSNEAVEATIAPIAPKYFETMAIPVLAGRTFVHQDLDTTRAVVVNEVFARAYFGGPPAVGRTIETRFDETDHTTHEVVGVVADAKYDLRQPAAPTIYIPIRLRGNGTIHVRIAGPPGAIAARLREEIRAATPLLRVTSITPQSAVVAGRLVRERLLAVLAGFFAVVGVVLAAVGLYGVLSYAVVQRTREIGIRMALGARPQGVVRMVLADTAITALLGAVCGLMGGVYLSRFVETLLFEVRPMDAVSTALPLGMLLAAAALAATIPARRAARVDPAVALRE